MGTSLINTGVQFPDATVQTTAAVSSSYTGGIGQVFTSSGTFTVPAGVTVVKVTVVGGGGAGGAPITSGINAVASGGGGGGGAAIKYITGLIPGSTINVTVGAGGSGGNGGTSSFGAYCSATGGSIGTQGSSTATYTSVAGGVGSGGDVNIMGGRGLCVAQNSTTENCGGAPGCHAAPYGDPAVSMTSFPGVGIFGGSGGIGRQPSASYGAGGAGTGYGCGGGGGVSKSSSQFPGGVGSPGVVIVEY